MHYQYQAGQWRVEFENLPCSEPQSTMSENLHQMRLAPQTWATWRWPAAAGLIDSFFIYLSPHRHGHGICMGRSNKLIGGKENKRLQDRQLFIFFCKTVKKK